LFYLARNEALYCPE